MNATTPPQMPSVPPLNLDNSAMMTQEETALAATWPLPSVSSDLSIDRFQLAI